jgi:A/G-specific adenine glycosylase
VSKQKRRRDDQRQRSEERRENSESSHEEKMGLRAACWLLGTFADMPRPIDPALRQDFTRRLRSWYRRNARDLPWRRTRDAYRVLVSELMLQQTQVSRVLDYYAEFLERFPTLTHVARAKPAAVMEAWEGLGYYARARNLHRLAITVTEGGRQNNRLPSDTAALRQLPGIGAYTAGAVASFAYEERAALVDTNVARVLKRVFAPRANVKTTRGQRVVWELAESVLPRTGRATWTHNQALMELGALICTARVAHCNRCPVRSICRTGAKHRMASDT